MNAVQKCNLVFDHRSFGFRPFFPRQQRTKDDNAATKRYNFYGCQVNGRFKYGADEPHEFLEKYRRFVLSDEPTSLTCAVVSLHYAPYHHIVLDFDCRDADAQSRCETVATSYLCDLFTRSGIENAEIYCLAKMGGKAKDSGLHLHVTGLYMAALDYLVLLAHLQKTLDSIDVKISCWSLPLASKSEDPESVYYPYSVYSNSKGLESGHCAARWFTREILVDTFLGIVDDGKTGVWQFPTLADEDGEDVSCAVEVCTVSSPRGSVRKLPTSLIRWGYEREREIFADFSSREHGMQYPPPFDRFDWKTFLPPVVCMAERLFIDQLEASLFPATVENARQYVTAAITNTHKMCEALTVAFGRDTGRILAGVLGIAELFERVADHYAGRGSGSCSKTIMPALVVDIYSQTEFGALGDPELDGIPRSWMTWMGCRSVPALALKQLAAGQRTVSQLAPFLLPITSADNVVSFYDNGVWECTRTRNIGDVRHLFSAKLLRVKECYVYLMQKKQTEDAEETQENGKKSKGQKKTTAADDAAKNMEAAIEKESLRFWGKYQLAELPRHTFTFVDGKVWDFKLNILSRPLLCWVTTARSELSAVEFRSDQPRRSEDLYFTLAPDNRLRDWPQLSDFLLSIFGNDAAVADYFVDTITDLVDNKKQKVIYFYYGERANNGKTTLLAVHCKLFGTMASCIQHNTLRRGFRETNPDLCRAAKSRFIILDELNTASKIELTLIKALSGNSQIYVRDLYQSGKASVFPGTLILATNGMPALEMTQAIVHRLTPIHFKMVFLPPTVIDSLKRAKTNFAKDKVLENCRPCVAYGDDAIVVLATQLLEVCEGRLRLEGIGERPSVVVPESLVELKEELLKNLDDIGESLEAMGYEITRDMADRVSKEELLSALKKLKVKAKRRADGANHVDLREFCQRVECVSLHFDTEYFYGIRPYPRCPPDLYDEVGCEAAYLAAAVASCAETSNRGAGSTAR